MIEWCILFSQWHVYTEKENLSFLQPESNLWPSNNYFHCFHYPELKETCGSWTSKLDQGSIYFQWECFYFLRNCFEFLGLQKNQGELQLMQKVYLIQQMYVTIKYWM